MNNVKKIFSIRDLENLSGIKAHTIRIWEKRYNLLTPERTDTNIRTYSLSSLQKLLNITLLYDNGYKISKIAKIPESDIPKTVKEVVSQKNSRSQNLNAFKLAMMNFDQTIFFNTYEKLLGTKSFREIFKEVFIPLLNEIGLLWQTDTISPAHEHFITSLIKQKILVNTESLQNKSPIKQDKVFVSFLPENEIHDIGILYLNYEILLKGYKVVYLGQTIPIENLVDLIKYFDNVYFLSYFTVKPDKTEIDTYIEEFKKLLKDYPNPNIWILGRQIQYLDTKKLPKFIKTFTSIEEVTNNL
ncbi:MerR family transcriptional regulator [Maribacter cobaltidurans]|uniref:MerR family transcriptional regulator n=1 Tax=Maribacter cobaltidurans TaxID=1178778 RepID=A0A223VB28_9FLAO|nr:MerR family transcriptional regulator [Maribacter cobaltidurans]ASV32502.1 MerR family transcriptional regulator [Maribacter cobaltidurans]GGD72724.1 MerR family transcriptional regulator [Maribacter cobaltidurans]